MQYNDFIAYIFSQITKGYAMKKTVLFLLIISFSLCVSCSSVKNKNSDSQSEQPPQTDLTETSQPFSDSNSNSPFDSSVIAEATSTELSQEEQKNAVENAVEFLSQIADFQKYNDYISSETNQCSRLYKLKDEFKSEYDFSEQFTLSSDNISVILPTTAEKLKEKGFSQYAETNLSVTVEPQSEINASFLCPSGELTGFIIYNNTNQPKAASELEINAVTLTSANNFTAFGKITHNSDAETIIQTLGLPTYVSVSADSYGCAIIFEYYNRQTSQSATILFDGTEKSLIAIKYYA